MVEKKMAHPSWEEVEAYLSILMNLPREEAETLLTKLERENPDFAAHLRKVWEVDAREDWFLDAPLIQPAEDLHDGPRPSPDPIEPYRILHAIGHGGMGDVYLAENKTASGPQKVAIKYWRGSHKSIFRKRLFQREVEILSLLDHPFIARLIDSGTTANGQPYLVMDYVEGLPITQYFEKNPRPIKEILQIFLKICQGVHHAHQKLVIHRDLKPEHILITADGTPKILDFGIGKVLEGDDGGHPDHPTAHGMLTPHYASPEQIFGEAASIQSDIFGLGTMLYELLTWQKPFAFPKPAGLGTLAQVFDKKPEKPSKVRRAFLRNQLAKTASSPFMESFKRSRAFPKDLDFIILKALRKEPERRYGSVLQFSEDLQRFLDGKPIIARKDTFFYTTEKFLKRHPFGVTLFLVGLFILSAMGFRLHRQIKKTRVQKERAEQTSQFLLSIFDFPQIYDSEGETISAKALLDHAVLELEAEGPEPASNMTQLHGSIGQMYQKLGIYNQAETHLQRALQIARDRGPLDQRPLYLTQLGEIKFLQGALDEAEQFFQKAMAANGKERPRNTYVSAMIYCGMGEIYFRRADFERAEAAFEESLAFIGRDEEGHLPLKADLLNNMALLHAEKSQYEQAEAFFADSLAIRLKIFGPKHPYIAKSKNNFGSLYAKQGRYGKARDAFRESTGILEKAYGGQSPQVFYSLNNLAIVYRKLQDLASAEATYQKCIAIGERHFGENSQQMATLWSNFGILKSSQKHFAQAIDYHRKALSCFADKENNGIFHKNLADSLLEAGQFEEGEQHLNIALKKYLATHGENSMQVASIILSLGKCQFNRKDFQGAKERYQRAMAICKGLYSETHLYVASTHHRLAQACAELGEKEEAIAHFERAIEIRERHWKPDHRRWVKSLKEYKTAMEKLGDRNRASALEKKISTLNSK